MTSTVTKNDEYESDSENENVELLDSSEDTEQHKPDDDQKAVENNLDKKPMTPIPMGGLIAVCFIFMTEGFNYCFLFPFVGFMIMDFGLAEKEQDAGYYAGQLAGCFALAQLFSGFVFGYVSDKFSKRKVFLVSCIGTSATMIAFGFSRSFGMAVLFRTLCGTFNGNVSTGKAYLADITDSTNQAYAYSYYGLTFGIGAIMGPAIGGLLSRPAKVYSAFDIPFFRMYPYILPCLFCAFFQIVALIMCMIFMKDKKDIVKDCKDDFVQVAQVDTNDDEQLEIEGPVLEKTQEDLLTTLKNAVYEIIDACSDKEVIITCTLYFFCSACDTMQEELFPLWSIIPSASGGLSFTNQTIGIYNTMQGILLLIQPTCFRYVAEKLGKLDTFRLGFLCVLPFTFTPLLNVVYNHAGGVVLWIILAIYCFFRMFTTMLTFTAVFILINNAAPHGKVGTVMGFSNSAGCIARAVATFSAGTILSYCASNIFTMHTPFFIACGLMSTLALGTSSRLSNSINELKNASN
ncbi:zinc-induced facilitator [Acrasis kona]|uniref:Zinc-induced facilitator n=1 Tax=Acrasis kona TaxID=1008807 RepID=A0AAW2Z1X2_9EUKA